MFVLLLLAAAGPALAGSIQTLRRGNSAEPPTLDPQRAGDVAAGNILRDLFEGLTGETPDGKVTAGAARHWEAADGGRGYVFHLREDGRWSNGDPVTAADFVTGLRRAVDPATGSPYGRILAPILYAADVIAGRRRPEELGVEALDRWTLRVRLAGPAPYFLTLLANPVAFPVHRPSLRRHGDRYARAGRLVSNGAYRLVEWTAYSRIVLARNPLYWDDRRTRIDRVEYYPVEDPAAELNRYRAGDLDWTDTLPQRQVRWIRRHLAGELRSAPYLGVYFFGFNLTRPPFRDNRALRRALALAVDREVIVDRLTGAGERPAYALVPPGTAGYPGTTPADAALTRPQRLARARRLYREAGYSAKRPLAVEIRYNTSDNHRRIAVALASMWKQALGVRATLLNEEWKVFLHNRRQRILTEVFRAGWIGDYNDAYSFLEIFHSAHGRNDTGYADPAYDTLLEQSLREADPARRQALLARAERRLLDAQAVIPIYFYVSRHLVKPWVRGYRANMLDHHYSKHLSLARH